MNKPVSEGAGDARPSSEAQPSELERPRRSDLANDEETRP
jgi:hypothetical protein